MRTLKEVYDAVEAGSAGVLEREGYCEYYSVSSNTDVSILTVPTGQSFVILKVCVTGAAEHWSLRLQRDPTDKILVLGGAVRVDAINSGNNSIMLDFPDRCVVVESGETIKLYNTNNTASLRCQMIGYFYDVP